MKKLQKLWQAAFSEMPLIAILRGIEPAECIVVARAIFEQGFTILEIPLNSPDALVSIALLREEFPDKFIGAGTVLTVDQVTQCQRAGCQIIIAPNFNLAVATACEHHSLIYCPGVATPSEAFSALQAGADALKLFPAELITPSVMKAMLAVLPDDVQLIPVGGVDCQSLQTYHRAGARGYGIGSALYKPGKSVDDVRVSASEFVKACAALTLA